MVIIEAVQLGQAAAMAAAKARFNVHIAGKNITAFNIARADIVNGIGRGE
jgi:hypothetical protein